MKIVAVTRDQLILIDGISAQICLIGGFTMQRGEWAVHFDTKTGVGHIEYIDIRNNQPLTTELFNTHYAWLIAKHGEFVQWQQEQAALEQAQSESNQNVSN
ncbi:hypothetical protein [Vibrio scophthalmi]|uniref:Uncharacterized protein n=1 Tax=Vibrio scophthalmi TaxID=45658 RepID=A0A1E3WK82_9VIBR|nr:hypothetical protein [Vibrio scophthalmi]ODS10164.1 hypothetical protein VSF3289_00419 [Vibrio scophthalmi]